MLMLFMVLTMCNSAHFMNNLFNTTAYTLISIHMHMLP